MRVGRLEPTAIMPAATIATISIHSSMACDLAQPGGLLDWASARPRPRGRAWQRFMGRAWGCARTARASGPENGRSRRLFRRKSTSGPEKHPGGGQALLDHPGVEPARPALERRRGAGRLAHHEARPADPDRALALGGRRGAAPGDQQVVDRARQQAAPGQLVVAAPGGEAPIDLAFDVALHRPRVDPDGVVEVARLDDILAGNLVRADDAAGLPPPPPGRDPAPGGLPQPRDVLGQEAGEGAPPAAGLPLRGGRPLGA